MNERTASTPVGRAHGVGSGANAHRWASVLVEECDRAGLLPALAEALGSKPALLKNALSAREVRS